MAVRSSRRMGQNFLISHAVADAEAVHAFEKNVLEIGPGRGMLTRKLCENAGRVVAVERDPHLYEYLEASLNFDNLQLINADFFDLDDRQLGLDRIDMVIANVPYSYSSKTIEWLHAKRKEAVLCLQKEFVEHMIAQPDMPNYSKLSVMCGLCFRITEIMNVPRRHFRPMPQVDSKVIYIKPIGTEISDEEEQEIGLLMQHKKKTLRNAVLDSHKSLNREDKKVRVFLDKKICDQRVFKMSPESILEVARKLLELQKL